MGNILTWLDPPELRDETKKPTYSSTNITQFANTALRRENVENRHRSSMIEHLNINGPGAGAFYNVLVQGNPRFNTKAYGNSLGTGAWPIGMGSMRPDINVERVVNTLYYQTDIRVNASKFNNNNPISLGQNFHAPPLISYQERAKGGMGPQVRFENPTTKADPTNTGFGNFGKSIYFERQKPLRWYNVHKPTTLKGQ